MTDLERWEDGSPASRLTSTHKVMEIRTARDYMVLHSDTDHTNTDQLCEAIRTFMCRVELGVKQK
jgi:hypothetical protein